MADLALDAPVTLTLDGFSPVQFNFASPGGKFVFTVTGDARAVTGIYMGPRPIGSAGKLRINPGDKPCVCALTSVGHLVVVRPEKAGQYTLSVRRWQFSDYFTPMTGGFRGHV
jgi:hypothetical protein